MIAYFDTSALVKLFLDELGSDVVGEVWDAVDARVTSVTAYPEARSALTAAERAHRIDRRHTSAAVTQLDEVFASMSLTELGWALALEAGGIARDLALRGYDAVHLASALAVDEGATTVVTFDVDLAQAPRSAGLGVAPA